MHPNNAHYSRPPNSSRDGHAENQRATLQPPLLSDNDFPPLSGPSTSGSQTGPQLSHPQSSQEQSRGRQVHEVEEDATKETIQKDLEDQIKKIDASVQDSLTEVLALDTSFSNHLETLLTKMELFDKKAAELTESLEMMNSVRNSFIDKISRNAASPNFKPSVGIKRSGFLPEMPISQAKKGLAVEHLPARSPTTSTPSPSNPGHRLPEQGTLRRPEAVKGASTSIPRPKAAPRVHSPALLPVTPLASSSNKVETEVVMTPIAPTARPQRSQPSTSEAVLKVEKQQQNDNFTVAPAFLKRDPLIISQQSSSSTPQPTRHIVRGASTSIPRPKAAPRVHSPARPPVTPLASSSNKVKTEGLKTPPIAPTAPPQRSQPSTSEAVLKVETQQQNDNFTVAPAFLKRDPLIISQQSSSTTPQPTRFVDRGASTSIPRPKAAPRVHSPALPPVTPLASSSNKVKTEVVKTPIASTAPPQRSQPSTSEAVLEVKTQQENDNFTEENWTLVSPKHAAKNPKAFSDVPSSRKLAAKAQSKAQTNSVDVPAAEASPMNLPVASPNHHQTNPTVAESPLVMPTADASPTDLPLLSIKPQMEDLVVANDQTNGSLTAEAAPSDLPVCTSQSADLFVAEDQTTAPPLVDSQPSTSASAQKTKNQKKKEKKKQKALTAQKKLDKDAEEEAAMNEAIAANAQGGISVAELQELYKAADDYQADHIRARNNLTRFEFRNTLHIQGDDVQKELLQYFIDHNGTQNARKKQSAEDFIGKMVRKYRDYKTKEEQRKLQLCSTMIGYLRKHPLFTYDINCVQAKADQQKSEEFLWKVLEVIFDPKRKALQVNASFLDGDPPMPNTTIVSSKTQWSPQNLQSAMDVYIANQLKARDHPGISGMKTIWGYFAHQFNKNQDFFNEKLLKYRHVIVRDHLVFWTWCIAAERTVEPQTEHQLMNIRMFQILSKSTNPVMLFESNLLSVGEESIKQILGIPDFRIILAEYRNAVFLRPPRPIGFE